MVDYTTRKRLEKQTPGTNNNAWGANLNSNTIDLVDECFGVVCVAMTTAGDSNLSQANGLTDEGRRSQIILTGAPTSDVRLHVPAVQSFYLVRNKMTGTKRVRLTNSGGTNGVDFSGSGSGAEQGVVISDGTNVREVFRTTSAGAINALTSTVLAAVSDNTALDTTGGASNDKLPFYDESETGGPLNRVPVSNFFNNVYSDLTETATVSVSDGLFLYDQTGPGFKSATVQSLLKSVNTLTEDTLAGVSSNYVLTYDTSASDLRKVALQNTTRFVNSGTKTATYTATTGDRNGSVTFSGLSANVTLNLPAAVTFGYGNILWVSNEDTSTSNYYVTVDGNGSETIDGQTTRRASRGTRICLMAISGGWKTVCGTWVVISSANTPSTANSGSASHGHSTSPDKLSYYLLCTTTDLGYSAGEKVVFSNGDASSTSHLGLTASASSTSFVFQIGQNGIRIVQRQATAGQIASIDSTKWDLIIVGEW